MMPTRAAAARARFVDHSLDTAPPARRLTLLYDRLVLDIARGEKALREGDRASAHGQLLHAQDIVTALADALDTSWVGTAGLASLYDYLARELIQANVTMDADRAATCRELVEPLRDAWHSAAGAGDPAGSMAASTAGRTA